MNLFSINYVHIGAPKYWYMIAADQGELFEKFVEEKYLAKTIHRSNCTCKEAKEKCYCPCSRPLKHKNLMIDPKLLLEFGIKFAK